jgi:hypothetical protein
MHYILDFFTPQEWVALGGLLGLITFLYKISHSLTKAIRRQVVTWETLVTGFPEVRKEMEKIRKLLEDGQQWMERHELKDDARDLRINIIDNRVTKLEGA